MPQVTLNYNPTPGQVAAGDLLNNDLNQIVNALNALDSTNLAAALQQALFSPGDLKPTGVAAAPAGWLLCDGSLVSKGGANAALFAAVGHAFNGGVDPGGGNFKLPDLRGRTPVGSGTGTGLTARLLGATGGEEAHGLLTAELPAHNHSDTGHGHSDAGHAHGATLPDHAHGNPSPGYFATYSGGQGPVVAGAGGGPNFSYSSSTAGAGALGVSVAAAAAAITTGYANIGNTGGGGSHNNMQPWQAVNWLVKL